MATPTLDPKRLQVIFNGYRFSDFVKGTFLSVQPLGEGNQLVKGVMDTSAWIIDSDSSYTIDMTLMATGSDNDYLSSIATLENQGLSGDKTLFIKDLSGRTVFESHTARLYRKPGQESSNEATTIVWQIKCATSIRSIGGNNPM